MKLQYKWWWGIWPNSLGDLPKLSVDTEIPLVIQHLKHFLFSLMKKKYVKTFSIKITKKTSNCYEPKGESV